MKKFSRFAAAGIYGLTVLPISFVSCSKKNLVDEAKASGKTAADFPEITADVFAPMDGGIQLAPDEIMGRNAWILWSAGNDHFWNGAAQASFELIDLLKTLDNRKYPRGERFNTLGLINQPGFRAPAKPDEFGLMLDEQIAPEPTDIDERVYGKPSGVIGFRLFRNPDFDQEARRKWDGYRFMKDPTYYNDKKLVRPYRVGVTCASCHVAPNPVMPPTDPNNPRWGNLASAIGNQYINEGKVFACNVEKGGFFYEELAAQPRGTSDTSRIATDHINNPNAINPIFLLAERERIAATETLGSHLLESLGQKHKMPVPHILKDGADSVGIPAAALRVYVNIGMFSEYWLTRHNQLIGLTPQQPFETLYAHKNSVFWQATEQRVGKIAAFFRKLQPFHLADADADGYLNIGPIPKGMPINLIANLEPDASQLVVLEVKLSEALLTIHAHNLSPEASAKELLKAVPELLAANKCPDFIEDEGHYFGTELPDADKRALLEYLKTF